MIRRLLDDRVYLSDLRFQYESIIHTLNDEAVNCKYILNSGFQLGVGQTSIAKTPSDFISVDIGYVNKTLSVLDFGKTVSNFDYVNGLVSIFHERQHVYQQQQDFTGLSCRDDAFYLGVNHIACMSAHNSYYLATYATNPRELDAEHQGVADAYDYLENVYGQDKASDLILDYANVKLKYCFPTIQPTNHVCFQSIDELDNSFDVAFEKSKIDNHLLVGSYDNDIFMQYLKSDDCHDIWSKYISSCTGEQKDFMTAAISLHLCPDDIKACPILKDTDFSAKTVFGIDAYPDVKDVLHDVSGKSYHLNRALPVNIEYITNQISNDDDLTYD